MKIIGLRSFCRRFATFFHGENPTQLEFIATDAKSSLKQPQFCKLFTRHRHEIMKYSSQNILDL